MLQRLVPLIAFHVFLEELDKGLVHLVRCYIIKKDFHAENSRKCLKSIVYTFFQWLFFSLSKLSIRCIKYIYRIIIYLILKGTPLR